MSVDPGLAVALQITADGPSITMLCRHDLELLERCDREQRPPDHAWSRAYAGLLGQGYSEAQADRMATAWTS